MAWIDESGSATETHNRAGCPYLNQTGNDAVQDWASVLVSIDPKTLAADLRAELQQLQTRCVAVATFASAR
jgi:hypothetical protein